MGYHVTDTCVNCGKIARVHFESNQSRDLLFYCNNCDLDFARRKELIQSLAIYLSKCGIYTKQYKEMFIDKL